MCGVAKMTKKQTAFMLYVDDLNKPGVYTSPFYRHLVELERLDARQAFAHLRELAEELGEGQDRCFTRSIEVAVIAQVVGREVYDYWEQKTGECIRSTLDPLRIAIADLAREGSRAAKPYELALGVAGLSYSIYWRLRHIHASDPARPSRCVLQHTIKHGYFDRAWSDRRGEALDPYWASFSSAYG